VESKNNLFQLFKKRNFSEIHFFNLLVPVHMYSETP
jgi:hypothetical protein